jgi:hypothetical protein
MQQETHNSPYQRPKKLLLKAFPNQVRTIFSILIFSTLIFLSNFAHSGIDTNNIPKHFHKEINLEKPYENPSWIALMGGKVRKRLFADEHISTEDGSEFYTAEYDSGNWLKDEFLTTLKNLLNPASKQDFFCNYPARSFWVINYYSHYFEGTDSQNCPDLDKWRSDFVNYEFSLAFASSDYSQPASIFGHTFIALHHDDAQLLDGYAINYAANFNDQANSINYFFNGLVGTYPGITTISPLYKKINEYTYKSQRSIYFYKLKLSERQKKQFILTLWERKKAQFDYLFVSENCSYTILKYLQVLEPSIQIPHGLLGQVIPFETVRAAEKSGIIGSTSVIHPLSKKLQDNLNMLSKDTEKLLLDLIKQRITFQEWLLRKGKISNLLALQCLNMRIQEDDVDRVYARKLRKLMTQTASSTIADEDSYSIAQKLPAYTEILHTHLPNRSSITLLNSSNDGKSLDFNLRWAYHDLLDPVSPLLNSSSVEAFSGTFRINSGGTILEKLDIISVKSLPNHSNLFPKNSTNLNIALTRSDLTNNKLGLNLTWGRGLSKHTLDGGLFYGLINFEFLYNTKFRHSNAAGYSSELGYNRDLSDNFRLYIKASKKWYPQEEYAESLFYTGVNFFVDKKTAVTTEIFNTNNSWNSEITAGIRFNRFF